MRTAITFGVVLSALVAGNRSFAEEATAKATGQKPHVLSELLERATKRKIEIRKTVRDYTCTIVKRERINRILQDHRFIRAKVRAAGTQNGKKLPLAVHMTFHAPVEMDGREVIYIEGQNDGEMVVKRGGKRFQNVTTTVDPNSDLARGETLMHITHMGFDGMVAEIVAQLHKDIAADPDSSNTTVRFSRHAKINDRDCTSVVITHPKKVDGLLFHRAEFFIDNEYHLPVRVAAFDWPTSEGARPELLGEFTYTNVKINVGLTDADFDFDWVRTASAPR
jgi:hypothetical protein